MSCFSEEIFFPLIPVVRFDGDDASIAESMVDMVRNSPFGLRASVWTASPTMLSYFAGRIDSVGLLLLNDDHAQCPRIASPWGGPKRSGGPYGESHFFWEKTSRLQAIGCNRLGEAEIRAVRAGIGIDVRGVR